MRVIVVGGAGYVGAKLVPELLEKGYEVTVLDLFLFGEEVFKEIENDPKLTLIKGDVRDLAILDKSLKNCDYGIHLACISNDPSFELNPTLGKSINLDAFEPFVLLAKKHGIKRFIYASSSSVYGVKSTPNVTENMSLEPLTDYSKYKVECEKILLKYMSDDFICTVLRPATVCGYSPRQRFDVIVNILTNLAYNSGKIKITGGSQLRPNIHIDDMVRAYIHVLESEKEKIHGEIFNVGYQNHSVLEIGNMVKDKVSSKKQVDIEIIPTDDTRSYHISSDKIKKKLNFTPKYTIQDAVESLMKAFEDKSFSNPLNNKYYYNIAMMKSINLE